MFLARVIGTVVAAQKYEGLEGVKLLVVRAVDKNGRENGVPQIACDHDVRAGRGDQVYVVTAREASHAMPDRFVPVDLAVVAIVDEVYRQAERAVSEANGDGWAGSARPGPKVRS